MPATLRTVAVPTSAVHAVFFLPVRLFLFPDLPPLRALGSFITLSFFPFAASCSFDAQCFSVCTRFLLSSLCSTSLLAFLLVFFFCMFFYSPSSCFFLQSLLFLPDFLWACLSFEFATTSLPDLPCLAIFALLPILHFFGEGGRVRWGSGCSFRAFSHPRTPVYVAFRGRSSMLDKTRWTSATNFDNTGITLQNLTCFSGIPGNYAGATGLLPTKPPHESITNPIPG